MLNLFSHIVSDRQKQLNQQKDMDYVLDSIRRKCPQTLIDFFMLEREFNRSQCDSVSKSKVWEYPQVISKNIDELESRNSALFKCTSQSDVCKSLRKYIDSM